MHGILMRNRVPIITFSRLTTTLSSAYFSLQSSARFQYCFKSDENERLLNFVTFTTSRIRFIAQGEEIKKRARRNFSRTGRQ